MKASYQKIDIIKSTKTITGLLEEQGILPVREYGDKIAYLCPFPSHVDTAPSFFVYTNDKYESFYCWGCGRYGDVIEFYRYLHEIDDRGRVIGELGEGVESPDFQDEVDYAVSKIPETNKKVMQKTLREIKEQPGRVSLLISSLGFLHLSSSDFDETEYKFLEEIYCRVDNAINSNDISGLLDIYEFLTNYKIPVEDVEMNPFMYRSWQNENNKRNKIYDKYKDIEVYDKMR